MLFRDRALVHEPPIDDQRRGLPDAQHDRSVDIVQHVMPLQLEIHVRQPVAYALGRGRAMRAVRCAVYFNQIGH